ncbi:hypothetical protein H4R18_000472 [Coemansia javaensis]|uniref:Fungal-type protein kinase domain-containing protein n=1 Tax=Coemansia javaensis TaxID=2761396 RepID=A0A9W8HL31_9FUNG|nr:hypothetical protein H4R18_000472 [Coemansia javaensis]
MDADKGKRRAPGPRLRAWTLPAGAAAEGPAATAAAAAADCCAVDAAVEQRAFRIDVCGQQYSLPSEQPDPDDLDRQLRRLAQPAAAALCGAAAAIGSAVADAVEAHLEAALAGARRRSAGGRRRSMRRRASPMATAALVERQRMAESLAELCDPLHHSASPLDVVHDVLALLAAELRDAAADSAESSAGAAVRQIGRVFAAATAAATSRRRLEADGVVEFAMPPQRLGAAPDAAPDAAAADALVGLYTTRADAAQPFTTGLVEYMIAGMNRHARSRPNVRHAWGLLLTPGAARLWLMESDAIHVTGEIGLRTRAGRRQLAELYAGLALSEPWRLGADPSMRWRADIGRWAVECPADACDPQAECCTGRQHRRRSARLAPQPLTLYVQPEPLFVAESFFGRFTRCFAAARTPTGPCDLVLKDSWQLIHDCERPDDEISVLDHIRDCMDAAQARAVYPRLLCGGTVRVAGVRDTSLLVLDALDQYARWTVPHGYCRPPAAADGSEPRLRRVHRRMASGPIGVPLQALTVEHEVVAVLADAMRSHAEILQHAHVLHRDISLNNVMAVRLGGEVRGMLIDFDHGVDVAAARNQRTPGNVGTGPFMSIANLEGLDVPRTAVDDWESLICLLFCLAARTEAARDEMGAAFSHLTPAGVADVKREMFASPRALDRAIERYLNPTYRTLTRLIRALHAAMFCHPRCNGTARISLRGGRLVDPVQRRVQYAEDIHARCTAALATVALEARSVSSLSDRVAAISHQCCDLDRRRCAAIPECPAAAPEAAEGEPPSSSGGAAAAAATTTESAESLSTLLAEPAGPMPGVPRPRAYARSTSDTLTDTLPDALTGKAPQLGAARSLCQLPPLNVEDTPLRKRKGEDQDSPRTKRRKMIHDDDAPLSPSALQQSVPRSAGPLTPGPRRQLSFAPPSAAALPMGISPPKRKRFSS